MYAMQYSMPLPADYDVPALRERIGKAAHALDDHAGLGLKAYLFRERGVDGSPVNEYACFYLWSDTHAMGDFLFTGAVGFQYVIRAFGRPSVQHWTGVASVAGPARDKIPKAASRRITALPPDPDPDDTGLGLAGRIEREIQQVRALARQRGVHTAALAIDPRDWQLVRFVLWADTPPTAEDTTERYDVLHLSAPGLNELPHGDILR